MSIYLNASVLQVKAIAPSKSIAALQMVALMHKQQVCILHTNLSKLIGQFSPLSKLNKHAWTHAVVRGIVGILASLTENVVHNTRQSIPEWAVTLTVNPN